MNKVFSALEVYTGTGLSDEYAFGRRAGAGGAGELRDSFGCWE